MAEKISTPERLINWWLSWEDLNWPNKDVHDKIKRRAEMAAESNVTGAIIFGAHFRWDYLPYFTILHDHIATVCEELHKYGIKLIDRHSINLVHRYDTREEMRRVMLHSGPHLPFSPSREAAKSWEYNGKRLNDWRMIDVKTGDVLYYPQYASEGFCYRNPDFIEAYCDYAQKLISDTGIDGLAAEDAVHYMHYSSCACGHCQAEFKRRTGIMLPGFSDRSFWGNWENPAWKEWIELRYESGKEFFEKLTPCLPKDFLLSTCGQNSSCASSNDSATDSTRFVNGGNNYVHMEMSGNTPPYKGDPVTVNESVSSRMTGFSHHQAIAREKGIRSYSTGYGFTEPSANIIWAVNKILDTDCCFSTLKARLGLPDNILKTLPEEAEIVKKPYTFEKEHPELFSGKQLAQVGVFFSYETRNNTMFGNLYSGYSHDYSATIREISCAGISAHTVLRIPEDVSDYPVLVLSGVAVLKDDEKEGLRKYISNGGKVIVCGPSGLEKCKNNWVLPTKPDIRNPEDFFSTIRDGVWIKPPEWETETKLSPSAEENLWTEVSEGLFYNPHRISDGDISTSFADILKRFVREYPVGIVKSEGYLSSVFESDDGYILHFLAEDYDTDIDHELDEMRFHRSRVNFVNKVEPINVSGKIVVKSSLKAEVFTPFNDGESAVLYENGEYTITLPEKTSYAIIALRK